MRITTAVQEAETGIDAERWKAVLVRDPQADGRFVYAVTSTGVFCRPSCASRRPRRDRVRFFDDVADAERAGFRPCRRCRPLDPDIWVEKVAIACRLIARAESGTPSLARLAREVGGSPSHFLRAFRKIVGVTPREFADARRFERVRRGLRGGSDVTTALLDAGYGSSSRFYERAAPRLAMTPARYRDGAPGEIIRFATVSSTLGRVLVATTTKGVCAVSLGDSDEDLLASLRDEFPGADLAPAPPSTDPWVQQVVDYVDGRTPRQPIPLDVRATAFQWQVWSALRDIPWGETRTYGDIAQAIGRPRAARAVARACASNPVAVVVPCHRVVPAMGGEGGYRWGTSRKAALLARERRGRRDQTSTPTTS